MTPEELLQVADGASADGEGLVKLYHEKPDAAWGEEPGPIQDWTM